MRFPNIDLTPYQVQNEGRVIGSSLFQLVMKVILVILD